MSYRPMNLFYESVNNDQYTKNIHVPIIMGSESDLDLGKKISSELKKYGVSSVIRICSAHKAAHTLTGILDRYKSMDIKCYITIAGKSNALSALIDGYVSVPVIACPPVTDVKMYDLFSSTSMPSFIAPAVVLGYKNAALAAAKICGLSMPTVRESVEKLHQDNKMILHISDVTNKYHVYDPLLNVYCQNMEKLLQEGAAKTSESLIYSGKVRDIYSRDDGNLDMTATDRLSAFDQHVTTIPFKGEIINRVSMWWFNATKDIIPNHFVDISNSDPRTMTVKKCKVFPIEVIIRDYLTGSTETSIWTNYQRGVRNYCGNPLPDGLVKNQQLPETIVTPTTKGVTDELIDEKYITDNVMTEEEWAYVRSKALQLFKRGQEIVFKNGLILVDTKYEFGRDENGDIILVDELHTPDSSRFWIKHTYKKNLAQGKEPDNIDKEFLRKWLKKEYRERKADQETDTPINVAEMVTPDMVVETSKKYMQLYELITGKEFMYYENIM